jgi:hypothetical protein
MFRLVGDAFKEDHELHTIAVYCLTETIKSHLGNYFEEGYENEDELTLYKKVKVDELYKLLPAKFIQDMIDVGVNVSLFIPKKIAQFMLLLKKQEEETPDLFLEYVLDKMIDEQLKNRFCFIPSVVGDKKPELKKLLRTYAKDYLCIDDVKERNKYVKNHTMLLTEFIHLLGIEHPDDDSLAFWDWDFAFFDDWGFENVLIQSANGVLEPRGYGLEYTKKIFTYVGEAVPSILNS